MTTVPGAENYRRCKFVYLAAFVPESRSALAALPRPIIRLVFLLISGRRAVGTFPIKGLRKLTGRKVLRFLSLCYHRIHTEEFLRDAG